MSQAKPPGQGPCPHRGCALYRGVLDTLRANDIPFMVGGGFAFRKHTGIKRPTGDFDVFVLPEHANRALERLAQAGYRSWMPFPHWIGKVDGDGESVDIIFSSGNGIARVDQTWFDHAIPGTVFDHEVLLCPVEEMIWSKAFVMERERFDGADVLHLIQAAAESIDWKRLLARFGPHPSVLFVHLLLFEFAFPNERLRVPRWVMDELYARVSAPPAVGDDERLCAGTLLSRWQFLPDLERGYHDARLPPRGVMTPEQVTLWTAGDDAPPKPAEK